MTFPVLVASFLAFRGAGALGVHRLDSWRDSAAHALALMLVMTASAHFVPGSVDAMPNHDDLVAMVPPWVPFESEVVHLTGVLELLGAAGLVQQRTRRPAGIALALLFAAMLPANVHAAIEGLEVGGRVVSPLWQRVPEQLVYVAFALWPALARKHHPSTPTGSAAPSLARRAS